MKISAKQYESFVDASKAAYALKVRTYICEKFPEHSLSKRVEDLDRRINEVITFALGHNINAEINVLNLVILFLDRSIPSILTNEQGSILRNPQWSEDKRTEEFYLHVLLKAQTL